MLITQGSVVEVVRFGLVLLRYLHRTVCRELSVLELVHVVLQVLRVLQVLQVRRLLGRLVSSGDGLDVEVGPLVAVETGLSRQASNGRWKSCLFYPQVAK
jgi:hypothetical protein